MTALIALWPYLLALTLGALVSWRICGWRAAASITAAQLATSTVQAEREMAMRDADDERVRAEALTDKLARTQASLDRASAELTVAQGALATALAPGEVRKRLQDDFKGK